MRYFLPHPESPSAGFILKENIQYFVSKNTKTVKECAVYYIAEDSLELNKKLFRLLFPNIYGDE